jgi:hypothetical protein
VDGQAGPVAFALWPDAGLQERLHALARERKLLLTRALACVPDTTAGHSLN